jgi:hypothetical protein
MKTALVLAFCLALAAGAAGECLLRLDVSPASSLSFTGTSQASLVPGAFPVTVKDTGAGPPKIGLSGSMYLRTAAEGCPKTAADWLAAAGSLQLTTAPSGYFYKPLTLFPPVLATAVLGSVPLNISALELNMTLSSSSPAPATQATPFSMDVNATVTHGYVYSNAPTTGGPSLQALSAVNSLSTSTALLNVTQPAGLAAAALPAQQLNLVLQDFKVTFVSETSGTMDGRPWTGSLTFSLSGERVCVC